MTSTRGVVWGIAVAFSVASTANAEPVSRGVAQAVLVAGPVGGIEVRSHGGQGAPAQFRLVDGVAIRPYFPEGLRYCSLDWHVIVAAWFDIVFAPPADEECRACLEVEYVDPVFYSSQELRDSLAATETWFELDGEHFATQRATVKPYHGQTPVDDFVAYLEETCGCDYTATDALVVQHGDVISPAMLGVGEHDLTLEFTYAGGTIDFATTFIVDGPDSETCDP